LLLFVIAVVVIAVVVIAVVVIAGVVIAVVVISVVVGACLAVVGGPPSLNTLSQCHSGGSRRAHR